MSTLPLNPVVDVYYNLSPISAPRQGFNLGAIVGTSNVISQATRGVVYQSVDEMIEAGFTTTSPEYLAATVYFAASSKPSQLYVIRQVTENSYNTKSYNGPIGNGNTVTIGETVYTVGDGSSETTTIENIVTAAQEANATVATYEDNVLKITFSASEPGPTATVTIFAVAQGDGPEVNEMTSTVGEMIDTPLEALQDARAKNSEWYAVGFCEELQDSDVLAISGYIEATSTYSTYFVNSSNDNITNGVENNLFEQLQKLNYNRTCGIATKQPYTHIGAMAYAMGQMRTTANSSFTLGLKQLPGVTPDDYTSQQVSNVKKYNGNVYISRGSYYDLLEDGNVFSGAYYDEIIQLDKLVNTIQLNVMDVLYQNPKVPQTEGGVTQIMNAVISANQESVKTGFIAAGQWNGPEILELQTGDYLPDGYLVQAESINDQSQADRDARKCPNIYDSIKLAGAIQSVLIQVDVNR